MVLTPSGTYLSLAMKPGLLKQSSATLPIALIAVIHLVLVHVLAL